MFTGKDNSNQAAQNSMFDFSEMQTDDLKQTLSDINGMLSNLGWKLFSAQMQQQAAFRATILIEQESNGIDGCINREYTRGAVSAINFTLNFPQMLINGIQQELEQRARGDHEAE